MGADETKMDDGNKKKAAETSKVSDPAAPASSKNSDESSSNDNKTNDAVAPSDDAAPTEEEKMEIDAAVKNIEEHAQIDDPVEPPARNARKSIGGAANDEEDAAAATVTFIPMNSKSILSRLFDPDRKQKPQLWEHIKLVAPGPADNPPAGHIKWRSKDAVSAYCLKCRKQFTYTKGTSKTISRHMQAYHGFPMTNEQNAPDTPSSGKRLSSSGGSTATTPNAPPLKKRKLDLEQSAQVLLLKWIVSSFQPWSIVESAGMKDFLRCLSDSFELPTRDGIIQIAMDHVEKVKLEIRRVLKDAEGYSLVCQGFQNADEKWYTSVALNFCTPSFERKSVCLGVIPTEATKETLSVLLNEYSLLWSKMSHITLTGNLDSLDLSLVDERPSWCVLDRMDAIVKEASRSDDTVSSLFHQALKATGSQQEQATSSYVGRAYTAFQGMVDDPDQQQKLILSVLIAFLKPFYDAHETLSKEAFSTVGLAIPVVRRINDVLTKLNVDALVLGSESTLAAAYTKVFCDELLNTFSKAFETILGKDPPNMWTIPLDPRLIHMGGLSEKEKESVMSSLVEKVAEKKLVAGEDGEETKAAAGASGSGSESAKKKPEESSTMGGIFWGDDSGDSDNKAGDQTEMATAYARANVDRYFTTVKSQRRIEDPLAWWHANQKDFPELGEIARVWLGGTVVGPSMDERRLYPGGNVELIAFLHDNTNMILGV